MRLTGKTLREQRKLLGRSQGEMAERAGITRPTIAKYESSDDLVITDILDAYCLEVYPLVGVVPADLAEIRRYIRKVVKNNLGVDSEVEIKIKLCGEDE